MHVIGREPDQSRDRATRPPTGRLGRYLARDGSTGATVGVDLDRTHAAVVVGKRGSGKSHTLGVLAEAAARAAGVAPVVVDPMGAFDGLAAPATGEPVPARVVEDPRVAASAVPPGSWPALVGLDPTAAAGALVWEAATVADDVAGMADHVADADADRGVRRVAAHLERAASWDAFDPDGLAAGDLGGGEATVLSLADVPAAPTNAVVAGVARALYAGRVEGTVDRLPWLFVDEAHVAFDGVASDALATLLTRGRAPGVSLVVATQRPAAVPAVATSQADLLVAHHLTGAADREALSAARPASLGTDLGERLPAGTGEALVVDDATESVHTVRVRERETPHGGDTARASEVGAPTDAAASMERHR